MRRLKMGFLKAVARMGIFFTLLGALASTADTVNYLRGVNIGFGGGYAIALMVGGPGALMALAGLYARQPHFWLACLIAGALYLASFTGYFLNFEITVVWHMLLSLSPGIILLAEGIFLSMAGIMQRKKLIA
jgi:hypothetical protein